MYSKTNMSSQMAHLESPGFLKWKQQEEKKVQEIKDTLLTRWALVWGWKFDIATGNTGWQGWVSRPRAQKADPLLKDFSKTIWETKQKPGSPLGIG